jgi:hypothetical protein
MSNPFQLLIDPNSVFQAVKDSTELNQLASRVHTSGAWPTPDAWDEFSDKVLAPGRSPQKVERAREAHPRFLRAHPETQVHVVAR